jgi:hypothetical protein
MRIKGQICLLHKLDNLWCLKYTENKSIHRVPFRFLSGVYQDGEELECYLEIIGGVEIARPIEIRK